MKIKMFKIVTAAAMMFSLVIAPINVFADQHQNPKEATTIIGNGVEQVEKATVSKFSLYGNDLLPAYNETFKMENSNITSITNNGGNYPRSPLEKAIDGDMSTHWETNKKNDATFTNEVIFNFNETISLNRIVYAARQDGAKGKGFAQAFDIYSSTTDKGDDFSLVSSGEYKGSTGDIVEIEFKPTEFKRLKFVYKKASQDWASASEFLFYKEDAVSNQMDNLFTDENKNQVSEEFNTVEKLEALEGSVKSHPLYTMFKEDIENALVLLEQEDIKATTAVTKPFGHYANKDYSKLFRMDLENIKSIRNNAGHYASQVIGNAVDGNVDTYWETNKGNSADFSNEVEVEFKEAVELNRITYGARKSDRKGFAEEFEIYASQTSKGDTYQLISTGGHAMVSGLVEAQFEPTTFKRVKFKFKKSNQNWATLSELAFYKEDVFDGVVNNIFTDGTMSKVKDKYNSIEKINKLLEEAKVHPDKGLTKKLEMAKRIVSGENMSENIFTVDQRGDGVTHARTTLQTSSYGSNLLPTGIAALAGEQVKVYVDVKEGAPLPQISFSQQVGHWSGWQSVYDLKPGENIFTVPAKHKEDYAHKVIAGGAIYIVNPYTAEQQGEAPRIRIEGGHNYPIFRDGDNVEKFTKELVDYKEKLKKDPNKYVDIIELVNDYAIINSNMLSAETAFLKSKRTPQDSLDFHEERLASLFAYAGITEEGEINHIRNGARANLRLMQPFAFAYASGDHTGFGQGSATTLTQGAIYGWAIAHEIGHHFDTMDGKIPEVTNNMWANYVLVDLQDDDDRVEGGYDIIFQKQASDDYASIVDNNGVNALSVWWQLHLLDENYWPNYQIAYRDNIAKNMGLTKEERMAVVSSYAVGMDVTEHFERYKFINKASAEKVRSALKELQVPEAKENIKPWYLWTKATKDRESSFAEKKYVPEITAVKNVAGKTQISLSIDKSAKEALLGYEVSKDGKVIGFTRTNTFTTLQEDDGKGHEYKVRAFDLRMNATDYVEVNSFQPSISVEEQLTLKLNQKLNPLDYVSATSYKGEDITKDIVIKSNNVDVTKKGNFEIVYEVKNIDIVTTKTVKVTVVSDYDYVSDLNPVSTNIAWGGLKKDLSPSGGKITLVRQGVDATYNKGIGAHANSEIVYNVENKGYESFESYIGIDQAMKGKASSATFEVWVDGEKKYNSNVFKADTERESIKVPISGAKEVKLITTDANNVNTADHTVWADAKFTIDSSKPRLKVAEDLTFVKLNSDFDVLQDVEASDVEDGNLKDRVKVTTNGFNVNKTGMYNVDYSVTDSDDNTVTKTREIYVYSDAIFASDTNWKSAQTAWKTVNKDKASSGSVIKLLVNGENKDFAKGIGTHANSEIVYDLEGKNYDYFETLVGVDRNIVENNKSSVTFKVLADGKEVYNSDVMKYDTEAKLVRLPVKDVKNLTLIASDSGNGNESDHADFADAKFYISNGLPQLTIPKSTATKVGSPIDINEKYSATDAEDGDLTTAVQVTGKDQVNFNRAGKYEITYTVTDSDGNKVTAKRTISVVNMDDYHYLSDFDWTSTQNSYTAPTKDISISANTLRLTAKDGSEVAYEKGIGAHSTSTIIYDLTDKDADYFTSFVGVDRQMHGSVGSVAFQVFVDGEKQFDSGLMNSRDPQQFVEVNSSGAKELKLVVTDGGNGNGSDHASWGDAKLHFANEDRIFTQDLEAATEEAKVMDTENYKSRSVTALQANIAKAESILANKQATQVEVDQAVEMLKQATDALVAIDLSQIITIPDPSLSTFIKQNLEITDEITLGDMYKLTSLSAVGTRTERVTSLEGLQYAKNLVTLDIMGDEVTDFSPLQGLEQLENLHADPQVIEMPSPTGRDGIFNVENLVKGLDGKHVNPTQIALSHNQTSKEVLVNVDQLEANIDQFSIDLTEEDKGVYMLTMVYEVAGNGIQIISVIDNN